MRSLGLRVALTSALVIGVISGVATTAFTAGDGEEPVVAATKGQPSYTLSNFVLQYPYIRDEGSRGSSEDQASVGVKYDTAWATESYPGVAMCRFDVKDTSGTVIGSLTGDIQALESFAGGRSWMPIAIEGTPASAEAVCSVGESPSADTGYSFSNVRIEAAESTTGQLHLVGDIAWKTGESPGTGDCEAFFTDGAKTIVHEFTLESGAATDRVIALLPSSMEDSSFESVSCVPFTGIQP